MGEVAEPPGPKSHWHRKIIARETAVQKAGVLWFWIKYVMPYYKIVSFRLPVPRLLEGRVLTCDLLFLAPFLTVPFPHCIYWHGERHGFFSNCSQMLKKGLLSCNHTGVKGMWNERWSGKGLPLVRRWLWASVFLLLRLSSPYWWAWPLPEDFWTSTLDSQHEKAWIYPRGNGHPSFLQKKLQPLFFSLKHIWLLGKSFFSTGSRLSPTWRADADGDKPSSILLGCWAGN